MTAFILESTDDSLVGVNGRIVDETKNTLILTNVPGAKTIIIPKQIVSLRLTDSFGKEVNLKGNELVGTPVERIYKF